MDSDDPGFAEFFDFGLYEMSSSQEATSSSANANAVLGLSVPVASIQSSLSQTISSLGPTSLPSLPVAFANHPSYAQDTHTPKLLPPNSNVETDNSSSPVATYNEINFAPRESLEFYDPIRNDRKTDNAEVESLGITSMAENDYITRESPVFTQSTTLGTAARGLSSVDERWQSSDAKVTNVVVSTGITMTDTNTPVVNFRHLPNTTKRKSDPLPAEYSRKKRQIIAPQSDELMAPRVYTSSGRGPVELPHDDSRPLYTSKVTSGNDWQTPSLSKRSAILSGVPEFPGETSITYVAVPSINPFQKPIIPGIREIGDRTRTPQSNRLSSMVSEPINSGSDFLKGSSPTSVPRNAQALQQQLDSPTIPHNLVARVGNDDRAYSISKNKDQARSSSLGSLPQEIDNHSYGHASLEPQNRRPQNSQTSISQPESLPDHLPQVFLHTEALLQKFPGLGWQENLINLVGKDRAVQLCTQVIVQGSRPTAASNAQLPSLPPVPLLPWAPLHGFGTTRPLGTGACLEYPFGDPRLQSRKDFRNNVQGMVLYRNQMLEANSTCKQRGVFFGDNGILQRVP